jgi:hypothetical protein
MYGFVRRSSRSASRRNRLAALVLLGATLPAHATNYWVGADSQCDYATIAAAISAASQ